MSGRVNHRGWIVLESITSDDALMCVDLFERPAGGFGFELFRADPEDGGRWTPIGGFAGAGFASASGAADAANAAVSWLTTDAHAARTFSAWRAAVASARIET